MSLLIAMLLVIPFFVGVTAFVGGMCMAAILGIMRLINKKTYSAGFKISRSLCLGGGAILAIIALITFMTGLPGWQDFH